MSGVTGGGPAHGDRDRANHRRSIRGVVDRTGPRCDAERATVGHGWLPAAAGSVIGAVSCGKHPSCPRKLR